MAEGAMLARVRGATDLGGATAFEPDQDSAPATSDRQSNDRQSRHALRVVHSGPGRC